MLNNASDSNEINIVCGLRKNDKNITTFDFYNFTISGHEKINPYK